MSHPPALDLPPSSGHPPLWLRVTAQSRLAMTIGGALALSALDHPPAAWLAAGLTTLAALASGQPLRLLSKRILALDSFILALVLTTPFTVVGSEPTWWGAGSPLSISEDGLRLASLLAARLHACLCLTLALVSGLGDLSLSRGLRALGLPEQLILLLLMTLRYITVIDSEYQRLRYAMLARGFRPSLRPGRWQHTLRSYGSLIGMLLVRSLDRAERVLAAMKCRGFTGRTARGDTDPLTLADGLFLLSGGGILLALLIWSWRAS